MSEKKGRYGQASPEKSPPPPNARRFRAGKVAFLVLIFCGVGLYAADWQMNQSYLTEWLTEQAAAAGVELDLPSGNTTAWTNTFDFTALVRTKNKRDTSETAQRVQKAIDDLRSEFHERYGPDSQEILQRGIYLLRDAHENLGCYNHTARRILQRSVQAANDNNKDKLLPFVLGVSGYSIAVGRGNFFNQSYSFVAADVLREAFELLGLDLQVRNHGIGGVPSFPYGWCLTQFLGQELDVLMWDYRLNEGGAQHDATLEAFVRNVLTAFAPAPPLFVLMDWTPREESKLDVLQYYLSQGVLPDAVGIGFDGTALDVNKASEEAYAYLADKLQNDPESLPAGFQNWTEWGSPQGTPGQVGWHMRFKQHEMAAWFVVMYFTNVLEIVVTLMDTDDWMQGMSDKDKNDDDVALPAPKTDKFMEDVGTNVRSMTYGVPQENDEGTWTIPPLDCFASFEPLVSGRLDQLVVSGLVTGTPEGEEFDPTPSRPSELYEGNWVVDLSNMERNAKQKTKLLDLGYIDAKVGLSGVSTSGPLRLWIPVSVPGNPKKPTLVRDVLETLVVCEVNEAQGRNGNPCKMTRDVTYSVSNINVSTVFQVESVAHYPVPICVSLEIPVEAEFQQRPTDGNFTDLWQTTVDVGEEKLQKHEEREWGVELELNISRTDLDLSVRPCTVSQIVTQTKVDQGKK